MAIASFVCWERRLWCDAIASISIDATMIFDVRINHPCLVSCLEGRMKSIPMLICSMEEVFNQILMGVYPCSFKHYIIILRSLLK